jgi:hypothetical protein
MKSIYYWFVLIVSIAVLVSSCSSEEDSKTASSDNTTTSSGGSSTTDTTAPTVTSVSTTADNQSSVSITDNITVIFSEAMDTTYVTTGTSDTNCAGTIRVSSDNFSTCVRMSAEPVSSNSNKTFTLDPYDNLTVSTTYKTRVTTGVKDTAGNTLSTQYETSSGFTTSSSSSSSSSSSIPSCSTYDIGSTAVSTSGNGTISFGNKYVSGKHSNSWQGVTPSGGCIDNSSALSSWSDSVPGGTGSFKHKFIVTSNSSHTIANYWYSDSNCSTSIGYSHKKYNSITVGDNTTGLNENLSRPSYGYKVDKTYAASTLKGITDNATTLLNSWFSDYCTLTKGVEYNVPAGQTVYKAYWNTADSGSTDWFWMSPKGTSGYSDWSDNDNWYYPDNGSWQLIARQVDSDNFTDGTHELFLDNASTTYLQNENDNSSSTFMSIGNLTPSNYVTDGKYKFKLEWDGLTVASLDNKSVTWTQTSWLDNSTIAGFQEIGTSGYVDNTTKGFDGLMKSNWSTSCVIDGNQGGGWFHCVGAIVRWGGGIPGPKGKVASSMHLYIWAP